MPKSNFHRNVFVNCPFDDEYVPLLRPLLFTLLYLGFTPRIALEKTDSGNPRVARILRLIRESGLAIHDLSRLAANKKGEVSRFNMPFELGLDIGSISFGPTKLRQKKCLILEEQRFRFLAALSDLSNSDILSHAGKPIEVVAKVRYWLVQEVLRTGPSATEIWTSFNYFMAHLYDKLTAENFSKKDIASLPTCELLAHMEAWAEGQRRNKVATKKRDVAVLRAKPQKRKPRRPVGRRVR
jgi:hypothetical protein